MKQKKTIWVPLCIVAALLACAAVLWPVLCDRLAPTYVHTYGMDMAVPGDLYQTAQAEPALRRIIEGLEDPVEHLTLRGTAYEVDEKGVGTAFFTFNFDGPGTVYSRFWERLASKKLTGTLMLCVSLPDSTLYQVNYIYGLTEQ